MSIRAQRAPRAALLAIGALSIGVIVGGCGQDADEPPPPGATTAPSADPDARTPTGPDAGDPAPHPAVVHHYSAGDAGRVLIALEGDVISLVGVDERPGWSHRVTVEQDRRIALEFVSDDGAVDVEATVEGEQVRVDVRAREE
jgi:hypothetical protein